MTTHLRSRLRACACVLALGAAAPLVTVQAASAQEAAAARSFDIPAGPLETALRTYALQSGEQILFDAALVAPLRAPRVAGRLTASEALERLLAGSGLAADRPRPGVVALHPAREPGPSASVVEPASVEAVVVTGSLIRGRSDGASPLVTLDRDALDREGRATVADALSALPQVFNGVATPQTQLLQTDGVGANTAASTGVNLRGLGSASTLVLLNGRRLGGSGLNGDFVDVSAIPAAAVDRIEVLLDGASALYGPDLAEEIIANCGVEIAFTPKELKIANELSERLGAYTYAGRSRSRPSGLSTGRRSQTDSDQRRALMLPQELLMMPRSALLVLRAGLPPVRGEKLVYYRERIFAARVRPPPPVPRADDALAQAGRVQALALEVAALRDTVEDIRLRVVERAMTVEEAAGEVPLADDAVTLALEDVDLDDLPADTSDADVRRFMREYLGRAGALDDVAADPLLGAAGDRTPDAVRT